ncbi:MAG: hypothetical protein KAJ63_00260, partial [Methyloprofundus sp.]|nr:hypothetical protein [Methyloprofundus sp.]
MTCIDQRKTRLFYRRVLYSVFILLLAPVVLSQDHAVVEMPTVKQILKSDSIEDLEDGVAKTKAPYDRLNRGTPRSSVISLTQAIKRGEHEQLVEFMDMRQVPKHIADQGPELIRKLKIVAQRIFWMGPENLSIEPEGHLDDGLPSYRDRVATIQTPDGPVDILMQRVPGDQKGVYIWKISNRTVVEIPRLYDLYGYGELGDRLSKLLPEFKGVALQPWQLVILLGILLFAYCVAWLLTKIIILLLRRRESAQSERMQAFFEGPVRFLILSFIVRNYFYLAAPSLKISALLGAKTLYIIAFSWLFIGVINLFIFRLVERVEQNGGSNGVLMLRPAARAIRVIVILVAIMVWLDNMG